MRLLGPQENLKTSQITLSTHSYLSFCFSSHSGLYYGDRGIKMGYFYLSFVLFRKRNFSMPLAFVISNNVGNIFLGSSKSASKPWDSLVFVQQVLKEYCTGTYFLNVREPVPKC